MSTEDNKALIRRFYEEVFNQRNLAALDDFYAPDHVDHTLPPGLPVSPEGTRQAIATMLKGFPDLSITIEDLIAEGDKVVTRFTTHGTQRGGLGSIPPTGKQVGGLDHRNHPHRRRQDCGRLGAR
jgi:predicted ester cyclase